MWIVSPARLILAYQIFYRYKYGNSSYIFKPTSKAFNHINSFISELTKKYGHLNSLGINFILDYFLFTFNRLEGQTFKRFATIKEGEVAQAGRIQPIDVFSKKALSLWLDRDKSFDYTLRDNGFIKKYDVSIYLIKDYLSIVSNETTHVNPLFEEGLKQKHFNSPQGFGICVNFTSMFHPKSYLCKACSFKNECITIQSQSLPNTSYDRGIIVTSNNGRFN